MGTRINYHLCDVQNKAGADTTFKQRLMSEPRTVLAEFGIAVDDACAVEVLEDTESCSHLVIPWNTPVNHRLVEHCHFPDWVFASDNGQHKEIVGRVVESYWSNPEFRARLLESPARVLSDYGLDIGSRQVVVRENDESHWYIVLPHN